MAVSEWFSVLDSAVPMEGDSAVLIVVDSAVPMAGDSSVLMVVGSAVLK